MARDPFTNGQWVVRFRPDGKFGTLAHLVESDIADRVIVKCGRQMKYRTPRGDLGSAVGHVFHCERCSG